MPRPACARSIWPSGKFGRPADYLGHELGLVVDEAPHVDASEMRSQRRRQQHAPVEGRDNPAYRGESAIALEDWRSKIGCSTRAPAGVLGRQDGIAASRLSSSVIAATIAVTRGGLGRR
jgi:hypothetical protein